MNLSAGCALCYSTLPSIQDREVWYFSSANMSKRLNPFSGGPQQFKTHVGVKEFANSSCGRNTLDGIHRHTKQLLEDGAKIYYRGKSEEQNYVTKASGDSVTRGSSKNDIFPCPSQYLQSSSFDQVSCTKIRDAAISCRVCKQQLYKSQCTFCDRPSCFSCLRTCELCCLDYCSLCSIVNYDNSFAQARCLSCMK